MWIGFTPRRVSAQRRRSAYAGVAQHPCEPTLNPGYAALALDDPIPPLYLSDSAQNVLPRDGGIILPHRIAAYEPSRSIIFHQPMDKNALFPFNQDNISSRQLATLPTLDVQNVIWPDRGKHAGSQCPDPDRAHRVQKLESQLKLFRFERHLLYLAG